MATIQQAIDIKAPVHFLYNQLIQFEDYPHFMKDVEEIMQVDETRLHWTMRMANRPVEWDAEITEQEADRCIGWHNISGPMNAGKVEVQEVGPDSSRVTFTLQSEPQQVPGSMAGNHEREMTQRLKQDLERLKEFIELRAQTDEAPSRQATSQTANLQKGRNSNSPTPTSSYTVGAKASAGDEMAKGSAASRRTAAEQRNDSAGSVSQKQLPTTPIATHPQHASPLDRKLVERSIPSDRDPDDPVSP